MNSDRNPAPVPKAADIVGRPVEGLSKALERALGDQDGDEEYVSYQLEDLLAGLPPLPEEALEPPLLLAEIAQPEPAGPGGWVPGAEASAAATPSVFQEDSPCGGDSRSVSETFAPSEVDPVVQAIVDADPAVEASTAASEDREGAVSAEDRPLGSEDDVLVLTSEYLADDGPLPEAVAGTETVPSGEHVGMDRAPNPEPQPEAIADPSESAPAMEAAPAPGEAAPIEAQEHPPAPDAGESEHLAAMAEAIITAHAPLGASVADKGDPALPERLDALATLLADPPPANDFVALDGLYACWPKGTAGSASRALLAVALNLSRNFGLPGKLPMASCKAWRMLSPSVFQQELAQRLVDVGTFIADWQKTQRTFLILEFGEIELIEHLFEALPPSDHLDLLAGVMNFKVLSNRRMGLLRRIPNRLKKQVTPMLPQRKDEALVVMAHTKALLEKVADPSGFAPIVDTATKMLEEVEKMMGVVAAIGAPPPADAPPAGGGMPLGRIG